jgi:anti-sigma regulatory factor (Ser/Thr protein kinase)
MSESPHIRVQLVSDPIYLSGARELVASVAKRLGFDDLYCSKIALAVDEALCNIIRHGYDRATDRPIWISLWPIVSEPDGTRQGVRIEIEDEARQVDPSEMKGRDLEDIRPGGLGVYIIKEVMDEVRWDKRAGRGMKLTMIKHPPKPGEQHACACDETRNDDTTQGRDSAACGGDPG